MLQPRLGFTFMKWLNFHVAGPAWVGSAYYQCARNSASTVDIPAIIEPVIAIAAGMALGNSRLITVAKAPIFV